MTKRPGAFQGTLETNRLLFDKNFTNTIFDRELFEVYIDLAILAASTAVTEEDFHATFLKALAFYLSTYYYGKGIF